MVKRLIVVFLILSAGFYFLLSGIFGENGVLANRILKEKLNELEKDKYLIDVQIENLSQKENELSTKQGLRDAALKLGYNVEGDEVYVFETTSLQKTPSHENIENTKTAFRPLSLPLKIIISISVSGLITLILVFIVNKKEKGKTDDFEQTESGNSEDRFLLD